MNEKQATYESRMISLKVQETKLADANTRLAEGFKQAKSEFDEKMALLRRDVEREALELERCKVWVEEAKATAEKGFQS